MSSDKDNKPDGSVVKTPGECTPAELNAFCRLVVSGGEVTNAGLLQRVKVARSLSFLYKQGKLIGVAALKHPDADYRNAVFSNAKAELDPKDFDCELGWVVVSKQHREMGNSAALVEPLIRESRASVYATSNTANARMHKRLERIGFAATGQTYPSKEHPGTSIALFVRSGSAGRQERGE